MRKGRKIETTSSCDQSRNYDPSVRRQFRCSLIIPHTRRGKILLLLSPFFFFPNVASLIDSLVTRGGITKNSEWLSIGRDQNHRDIPWSRRMGLGGGGSSLHSWRAGQQRRPGRETYTSSWQHHTLPTSWIASPYPPSVFIKILFIHIDTIQKKKFLRPT